MSRKRKSLERKRVRVNRAMLQAGLTNHDGSNVVRDADAPCRRGKATVVARRI